jgi:hypothetical protein
MFIETVPNRTSPPAVLLRESYRDERGRAQKRTLANLSKLPAPVLEGLKAVLPPNDWTAGRVTDERSLTRASDLGRGCQRARVGQAQAAVAVACGPA